MHRLDADLDLSTYGRHLLRLMPQVDGLLFNEVARGLLPCLGWQIGVSSTGRQVGRRLLEGVDAQAAVPEGEQLVHAPPPQGISEWRQRDAAFCECDDALSLEGVWPPIFRDVLREVGDLPHEGG